MYIRNKFLRKILNFFGIKTRRSFAEMIEEDFAGSKEDFVKHLKYLNMMEEYEKNNEANDNTTLDSNNNNISYSSNSNSSNYSKSYSYNNYDKNEEDEDYSYNSYNNYDDDEDDYNCNTSLEILNSVGFNLDNNYNDGYNNYNDGYNNDIGTALYYSTDNDNSYNSYDNYDDYNYSNDSYPLYDMYEDTTCYNNYNDSSYDYSSSNYWDN